MKDEIISILLCAVKPLTIAEIGNRLNFEYEQDEIQTTLNNMVYNGLVKYDTISISNGLGFYVYSM